MLGACILTAFSCEKSDINCGRLEFIPIDFTNYSSITIVDNKVEDKFLVINSMEEFTEKIHFKHASSDTVNELAIDFTKYTLLIGKKKLTGIAGTLVNQNVEKVCDSKKYMYKIVVQSGNYTAIGNFYYGVLISKITDEKINVHVEVLNSSLNKN